MAPPPSLSLAGTRDVNGSTVDFITLSIKGLDTVPNFAANCGAGGVAPLPVAVPLADATVNVTVFYNLNESVAFPYGDSFVNASAGSVKFNIDAEGWWVLFWRFACTQSFCMGGSAAPLRPHTPLLLKHH